MFAQRKHWTALFLLILFLVAFVPRAFYPVSRPLQWYERSFRFVDAVIHRRWADTIVSEHPGVTPMWLIGLCQHGYYALLQALGFSPPHPLDIAGRAFRTEIAVSILPLAFVIALGVLLTWWLLRNLFGEEVAWAGAAFLALDPFHIAISKVVHVDALLSVLMILSALMLLYHLRLSRGNERDRSLWARHRWLLASGTCAGLAFLTKSPAYFLVPFLGLSLVVAPHHSLKRAIPMAPHHSSRRAIPMAPHHSSKRAIPMARGWASVWRGYLAPVLVWAGAAAVTYVVFWPAMWVQPGQTLTTVIEGVFKHAGRAHPQPLYYLGDLVTEDPGLGFYGVTLLVKTTVLSLPFFVIGLVCPLTEMWRRERRWLGLLVAYVVFFFIQMGLGAKKAPRYLLPAFPALDIIAGVGLVMLTRRLGSWRDRFSPSLLIGGVLAVQAALVWAYHPYYITHASLLVGGPAGAQRLLLTTPEGEGLDIVAEYLNRLPGADNLRVGVQLAGREAFRQHFVGEVADTREPDLDYLVFADVYVRRHLAEDQWGDQWEAYKYRVPEYVAYLHGLPYAWLYRVEEGPQQPDVPLNVCVGERIRLRGYTIVVDGAPLSGQAVHPGDSLRLTLHWAASGTPEGYHNSVFVHLLGPDGGLVTQQDSPPLSGTYPTFLWEPGERVDDPYELTIPPSAPPGTYSLTTGMYDWQTGKRMAALTGCASRLPDDKIVLTMFEVRPQGVPWWEVLSWALAALLALGGLVAVRPGGRLICNWMERWRMPLTYLLLTLAMTYPVLLHLGTHYIGASTDLWMFPWNDWWLRRCLFEGRNPFYTDRIFHPYGVSAIYHNFAWLHSVMWIPLSTFIKPIAAHNLIFLFNVALAGVGMHLFVHYLTEDHRAALLAGIVFAFWPYRMSHFNHPNMISVGWVPFCMLFLARAIREEHKFESGLLAGLFFALTGIARWMHLIYTSGLLLVYLAYSVLFERQCWNWRTVAALVCGLGLATVLMAPLLSPLVVTQIKGGEAAEDIFIAGGAFRSTDLVSYLVPERGHPLFRSLLGDLWPAMKRGSYVGYVALALAGVGLLKGPRGRLCWFVVGAGLFIQAVGGKKQVAGRHLDIALPYSWVKDWFPVRVMRHPHRFNILLSFPLAVLVGYGVTWLLPRLKRAVVWTVGFSALILLEYLPWPYPTTYPDIPPFYQQLADEPRDFAILNLPLGTSSSAKLYMYYSTIHGKALVGGRVARLPRPAWSFIDSVPLLHGLHTDDEMDPALCDVSRQLSALTQANVRYVILHPSWVTPDRVARWREWLAVPPAYEDQYTIVYRTALEFGQDFDFLATMGDGIGVIDTALDDSALSRGRTLEVTFAWGSQEAPERDWLARMALVASPGTEIQQATFAPCASWPTSQWGESAVARGRGVMEIDAGVETGMYTVTLGLIDAVTGVPAGESLAIGQIEIWEAVTQ